LIVLLIPVSLYKHRRFPPNPSEPSPVSSVTIQFPFLNLYITGRLGLRQALANSDELAESKNREVVLSLYEALSCRDVHTVTKILAHDLEWWFHGPPSHQFMMRLLTGADNNNSNREIKAFEFVPKSIASFGSIVIAEGCDSERDIYWIHAWTVTDGIITQVREYFNTSLTVTRLSSSKYNINGGGGGIRSKSKSSTAEITRVHCPSIWESSLSKKSVPGLVLAI
ncbi:Wound-induced protein 1, partial [Linum grandiflorum]